MNERSPARHGVRLLTAGALIGMLMLAACASTPPAPTASLDAAKQAISNAERADAAELADVAPGLLRTVYPRADQLELRMRDDALHGGAADGPGPPAMKRFSRASTPEGWPAGPSPRGASVRACDSGA